MTRWLVVFDDNVFEADTPGEALEQAIEAENIPWGATVFVVDLDVIEKTDYCTRMGSGAYEIPKDAP
jgi:hypothetical protein